MTGMHRLTGSAGRRSRMRLTSEPEGGEAEGVEVGVQSRFGAPAVLGGVEECELGSDLGAGRVIG